MRDGTVPAVATGRELSGRRTTEEYLLHSRLLAFMARRHAIVLELCKAHLQAGLHTRNATKTRPPRTISHASPLAATPGAKIVRATLERRAQEAAHTSV
jgi:hypothetical protein